MAELKLSRLDRHPHKMSMTSGIRKSWVGELENGKWEDIMREQRTVSWGKKDEKITASRTNE